MTEKEDEQRKICPACGEERSRLIGEEDGSFAELWVLVCENSKCATFLIEVEDA